MPAQTELAPAPERAQYQRACALSAKLAVADTQARAAQELKAWLAELRAEGFGVEEPEEFDTLLASVTALSAQAIVWSQPKELLDLLEQVRERLEFAEHPPADLAFAMALGWRTLLQPTLHASIPLARREADLQSALKAAEGIEPRDSRDLLGCTLALGLHDAWLEGGDSSRATDTLERGLAVFSANADVRPRALLLCADERRLQHKTGLAWNLLAQAEAAAEHARQPDRAVLERTLASETCQLEIFCGLLDRAARSLEREREALEAAQDFESRVDYLFNLTAFAMATPNPSLARKLADEVDGKLKDEELFASHADYRARLQARRAILQHYLEEMNPAGEHRAAALMQAAFELPGLDDAHRAALAIHLADNAFQRADLTEAERWLDTLDRSEIIERLGWPGLGLSRSTRRARLALARGAEPEVLKRHAKELDAQLDAFLGTRAELAERSGGFGFLLDNNRQLLLGTRIDLALALEGAAGPERALDIVQREQALGSLARQLGAHAGSLHEVQTQLLRPGLGLLLYAPGYQETHLFVIDGDGVSSLTIPWRYEREPDLVALNRLLASSPAGLTKDVRASEFEDLRLRVKNLSGRLIPEAVRKKVAGWNGLYVVGAELLGGVPFECLTVGESLGTKLALAYLPSLPVGLDLARRCKTDQRARQRDLLLVAAPKVELEGHPELAALPFDREALTRSFDAEVLSGAGANLHDLKAELRAHPPRILHFFVHGVPDFRRELSGGLALAPCDEDPDGIWWCEEVQASKLEAPPLVVLSACNSASGPLRRGDDGVAQLGGAFLSLGALCTVQAASDIALVPSERLMSSFHAALAKGASPAEALRLARVALAEDEAFAHPFYTMSMRVVGLGLEPLVKR